MLLSVCHLLREMTFCGCFLTLFCCGAAHRAAAGLRCSSHPPRAPACQPCRSGTAGRCQHLGAGKGDPKGARQRQGHLNVRHLVGLASGWMRGTCRGRPVVPLWAPSFQDLPAAARSWHKARTKTLTPGHGKDPRSVSEALVQMVWYK